MTRRQSGNVQCRLLIWMVAAVLLAFSSFGTFSPALAFDFQCPTAHEWTTSETFSIEGHKVLGLFNDRNKKYLQFTHLNLKDLPPKTPVTITFDLYLVGTWDSSGQLADRWTLTTSSSHMLLDLTQFPNKYQDKEETTPIGNNGSVKVATRSLDYWVVKQSVVVPPDQVVNGALSLRFEGSLTGRKTEFWGIDNVRVQIGK